MDGQQVRGRRDDIDPEGDAFPEAFADVPPLDNDLFEELEQLEKEVAEEMKTDEEQERREALEEIQKRGLFPVDAVPGEPERNLGDSSAILRKKYQERIEAVLAGDDANTCNDDAKQKVA